MGFHLWVLPIVAILFVELRLSTAAAEFVASSEQPPAGTRFKEIGRIRGYKIEIGPFPVDFCDRGQLWVKATSLKSPETVAVQSYECNGPQETRYELKIVSDVLTQTRMTPSRYTPDVWIEVDSFKMGDDGNFKKLKSERRNPFEDQKADYAKAVRRKDLPQILKIRGDIVSQWASSYDWRHFDEERRKMCWSSLRAAFESGKPAEQIKPFLRDAKGLDEENSGCAFVYSADDGKTDACGHGQESCPPPDKRDVQLLNDVAFRMQQGSEPEIALGLLKTVLRLDPKRVVAYRNLSDTLADLKQPTVATLARLIGTVLKEKRKKLNAAELTSLKSTFDLSCADLKLSGLVADLGPIPRVILKCEGQAKPLLEWDVALDQAIQPKDMVKVPVQCPLSKTKPNSLPLAWIQFDEENPIAAGFRSRLGACSKQWGAIPLKDCNWVIACGGGLDRGKEQYEISENSIVDFVEFGEIRQQPRRLARGSGITVEIVASEKGFTATDYTEFKTSIGTRKVPIGSWVFKCGPESCSPNYECKKMQAISFDTSTIFFPNEEDRDVFPIGLYYFLMEKDMGTARAGVRYLYNDHSHHGEDDPYIALDLGAMRENRKACY